MSVHFESRVSMSRWLSIGFETFEFRSRLQAPSITNPFGWFRFPMSSPETTKPTCRCPSCGARFRVDQKFLGRTTKCPNTQCGASVLLQAEPAPTVQPPESSRATARTAVQSTSRASAVNNSERVQRSSAKSVESQAPVASASALNSAERAVPRSKRTSNNRTRSRYETSPSLMTNPLVLGLLGTVIVGGLGLGVYSWTTASSTTSNQESVAAETPDEKSSPATAVAQTAPVPASEPAESKSDPETTSSSDPPVTAPPKLASAGNDDKQMWLNSARLSSRQPKVTPSLRTSSSGKRRSNKS